MGSAIRLLNPLIVVAEVHGLISLLRRTCICPIRTASGAMADQTPQYSEIVRLFEDIDLVAHAFLVIRRQSAKNGSAGSLRSLRLKTHGCPGYCQMQYNGVPSQGRPRKCKTRMSKPRGHVHHVRLRPTTHHVVVPLASAAIVSLHPDDAAMKHSGKFDRSSTCRFLILFVTALDLAERPLALGHSVYPLLGRLGRDDTLYK
ncbi:hypothetical protein EDD37DRAFT_632600 [Exophiala viscosa]|uniref:Secreted protein n=1 Tax=Exophiala viscosa TaxID=2486360 RepID=A0AAN6DV22_9EURO|nr:hypothetical protein EDD36DRAFT_420288 [Exophiala viscosa]KAI1623813.1 hypothetical protein EDD37DRAFT_632600 [Exophiala viscosa]